MNTLSRFFLLVFILSGFYACKKDEKQVIFQGGTAPVVTQLTSRVDSVMLRANRANEFVLLSWTNPEYQFNTGVSSLDVTYTIQVDTVGSNFSNPQEVSVSKAVKYTITVGDMNSFLTKLKLDVTIPHDVELRVVSNLSGKAKLYSNVLRFAKLVMYEDFALPTPNTDQLFIVGDGTSTNWNNNPAAPQFATRKSKGLYVDTVYLTSGKFFKYLTSTGNWQPQYGLKPSTGGTWQGGEIGLNNSTPQYPSDPDAIPTPPTSGDYIITMDFATGRYSVVPK